MAVDSKSAFLVNYFSLITFHHIPFCLVSTRIGKKFVFTSFISFLIDSGKKKHHLSLKWAHGATPSQFLTDLTLVVPERWTRLLMKIFLLLPELPAISLGSDRLLGHNSLGFNLGAVIRTKCSFVGTTWRTYLEKHVSFPPARILGVMLTC